MHYCSDKPVNDLLISHQKYNSQSIILFTYLKYDCIFTIVLLSTAMFIFLLIF